MAPSSSSMSSRISFRLVFQRLAGMILVDLDVLGIRFWQGNLQKAVLVDGFHLVNIHRRGKLDVYAEFPKADLQLVVSAALAHIRTETPDRQAVPVQENGKIR